jgi:hypothetical protein
MDRCNLTITQLPNYRYLPEFFAEHRVHVVASLPHFRQKGRIRSAATASSSSPSRRCSSSTRWATASRGRASCWTW